MHATPLFHFLLALAVVIALGRLLGKALSFVGQPPVIGEILAGILLGPSLLGTLSPPAMAFLMPADVVGHLGAIAQLGAILYMFLVGLELDTGRLREVAGSVTAVSLAGTAVPFLFGAWLAVGLHAAHAGHGVPLAGFSLFVGVAFSITAFPTLARILSDCGLTQTRLGVTAIGAAAAGDILAWCLLVLAQSDLGRAVEVLAGTGVFVAFVLVAVRPAVRAWARRQGDRPATQGTLAVVLVGVLLFSLVTEAIGVHAVFGAFLLGAVLPHGLRSAKDVHRMLAGPVNVLLVPAYFAFTGMRTQIGLVASGEEWLLCAGIVGVATAAKVGSAALAARLTGHGWRDAGAVGALMNARGLMELIVLNIGLDAGLISPTLYAMLVVMALATTMMTGPMLRWLGPRPANEKSPGTGVPGLSSVGPKPG